MILKPIFYSLFFFILKSYSLYFPLIINYRSKNAFLPVRIGDESMNSFFLTIDFFGNYPFFVDFNDSNSLEVISYHSKGISGFVHTFPVHFQSFTFDSYECIIVRRSSVQGTKYQTLDGTLSFSRSRNSFVEQLFKKKYIQKKIAVFKGTSVSVGEVSQDDSFYAVKSLDGKINEWLCTMKGISFGNIGLNPKATNLLNLNYLENFYFLNTTFLFDSFETYFFFPASFEEYFSKGLFKEFLQKELCSRREFIFESSIVYICKKEIEKKFPKIYFYLDGVILQFSYKDMFFLNDLKGEKAEFRIHFSNKVNQVSVGLSLINSMDFIFDYENELIGFMREGKVFKYSFGVSKMRSHFFIYLNIGICLIGILILFGKKYLI